MFDGLKKKAQEVGQAMADKTKAAAQVTAELSKSVASSASAGVSSSVDAQIERVLNLMERTAMRAARRDTITSFQVTANLTVGLAEIGLSVEYDVEALRAKQLPDADPDELPQLEGSAPSDASDAGDTSGPA